MKFSSFSIISFFYFSSLSSFTSDAFTAPFRPSSVKKITSSFSSSALFSSTTDEPLNLTSELQKLVDGFSRIPDDKIRYKNLMFMASKLPPIDAELVCIDENKVPGCLSTVHVTCDLEITEDGRKVVNYCGDSDGILTKGLLALLIRGLSGSTVEEIEAVSPNFIKVAGISQTLTPGRNNGFLNMVSVMKRKARELVDGPSESESESNVIEEEIVAEDKEEEEKEATIVTTFEEMEGKPMYNAIMSTLIMTLKPTKIELVDNSDQHAGHAGSKGWEESGESHFSLTIASEAFEGLPLVKRHQMVYLLLGDIMQKIHALQIKAITPDQDES